MEKIRRAEDNEESICCFEENSAEESIHEDRRLEAREERFDKFLDDSFLCPTPSKQPKMDMEFYKNASYAVIGSQPTNHQFEPPSIQSSDASSNLSSSSDGVSYLLATSEEGSPQNSNQQLSCDESVPRPGVLREIPVEKSSPVEKFYSSPDRLTESTRCQLQFCRLQTEVESSPPLPKALNSLSDATDVWQSMLRKEALYRCDSNCLQKHRTVTPRMRSVLLDWLMQVCEEFRYKRTTFYLACEYFDRFMSKSSDIPKTRLQVIGITSLFVAAKIEEIYPKTLTEYSDMTDGACTDNDITKQELILLHRLNWLLWPVTALHWLQMYVQLASVWVKERGVVTLNSSLASNQMESAKRLLVTIANLLDICTLDIHHTQHLPSILAASALYYFTDIDVVTRATGYKVSDICQCVKWMQPFATAYKNNLSVDSEGNMYVENEKVVINKKDQDYHTNQLHSLTMYSLNQVYQQKEIVNSENRNRIESKCRSGFTKQT